MFDLHRHDEYSTFDGFGKARELAALAKELGYKALGLTNHGNAHGLVKHYFACKECEIKPVLGVEGYFLPKYVPQNRGFHMILVAKNLKGFENLNNVQYEGEKQKFYNPIWDFDMLEKYHEGLICTTACVAGYLAQCIIKDDFVKAEKFLLKLKKIFKDDLYVEVQPYKVSDVGLQEKVNVESIKLAKRLNIKCILTSDSHRGRKEDFPTYMKMHEIAGHNFADIEATYAERYMPAPDEMKKRFYKMHKKDFGEIETKKLAKEMYAALDEIEDKVDGDILSQLELIFPKIEGQDSAKILKENIKKGLVYRGKEKNKEYIARCKEEYDVIVHHGFADYFLIVQDYVKWAKNRGIAVGPGRGSVCNSEVAYVLGITEVDSIFFGLDFRRFLRMDKKKIPDIDLDFQTSRRHEVIEYLCKKYAGHAARICAYGLYKTDNLINDLAKVCGLNIIDKDATPEEITERKRTIAEIKNFIKPYAADDDLNIVGLLSDSRAVMYNQRYDDIIVHFTKLFKKVRYIGTHAAGVAITGGDITQYTALKIDKDGNLFTNYDLVDIEKINVIKFDILGLKTMESLDDLRKVTGVQVDYTKIVQDKKIISEFGKGNCDGIFQFESSTPREILTKINCDCFEDIVAASSMNRPGPLSLKMPDMYAHNKYNKEKAMSAKYYKYTQDTYGTVIYQEQIMMICVYIGGMEWATTDKILKMMKAHGQKEEELAQQKNLYDILFAEFWEGAKKKGFEKDEAEDLFIKMTDSYSFNKGHGVGYSLISVEEMFYKIYYPNEYWYAKMKYAKDETEMDKFASKAVLDEAVIFLPHVNYYSNFALRKEEGENIIQMGLSSIKGVGKKAADYIEEEKKKNGKFKSYDDFYDRCKSRVVTSRVIDILKEYGALEFKRGIYLSRVKKYNVALYSRGLKKG